MAGFTFTLTLPSLPFIDNPGIVSRVRSRFAQEAGQIIIQAIRARLGDDSLYTLSADYAKRKPTLKKFVRFPGKSASQPIILSGEMFNALEWKLEGDTLIVAVQDGRAVSKRGFDYGEWFEEITSFLELGFSDVEDSFPDHLLEIIFQEMAL